MSSSPAISKNNAKPRERRAFPREALNHYVVLVYFGEDNWGKLTNMSESGMALEFSKPPSLRERVNFTFQVMGCMPVPREASVLGESFEAAGEIVWLREFERVAGVQFVELAERSREQIRQWLSFETSTNGFTPGEEAPPEAPPMVTELLAPVAPALETPSTVEMKRPSSGLHAMEPLPESVEELESPLAEEMPEVPGLRGLGEVVAWQGETPSAPSAPRPHPPVARLTFLVVSGCLAVFAVTAGVRIIMTRPDHPADSAERAPSLSAVGAESPGAVNVSSPNVSSPNVSSPSSSPAASAASSAEPGAPFQVEVLDANGKRWMLWFVHNGSKNGDGQFTSKRIESPTFSASTGKAGKNNDATPTETPQAPRIFTLVVPKISRPANSDSAASSLPSEPPAIQAEVSPLPEGEPIGGALSSHVAPAAPPLHAPVGGMVQEARLIHSISPVYPALAKSNRVSGDVALDALIDATGNVTKMKVISGPVLLQQAAMETVRHWKYEPARLDGLAVAMHLTVTVRFRLN